MFALPSEGSNPFCWGVLGELEGTFSKVPSNKPRPHKNRAPKTAHYLDDLRKKSAFLAKFDPFP